jgi:hypothetical protein
VAPVGLRIKDLMLNFCVPVIRVAIARPSFRFTEE